MKIMMSGNGAVKSNKHTISKTAKKTKRHKSMLNLYRQNIKAINNFNALQSVRGSKGILLII